MSIPVMPILIALGVIIVVLLIVVSSMWMRTAIPCRLPTVPGEPVHCTIR